MCKCAIMFIYSLVERNLCCFQFLVMMNEAAVNTGSKCSCGEMKRSYGICIGVVQLAGS